MEAINTRKRTKRPSTEGQPDVGADQVLMGDCLDVAAAFASGSFDLVYIDPPYFTRRDHARPSRVAIGETDVFQFGDRWGGGADGGRTGYLNWLTERVREIHRLLKADGVFLLHLDWHVVHYAKVLCDSIFGDDALQNELIWYYQTGGASKGRFSRKHDTILFYTKGPKFYFDPNSIAIPRTPGAMHRARTGKGARIAVTDTHKNPDDVLIIPALNPMSHERTGYPTQKPVGLLERLILGLCPPGGKVGDFFCGSGTTLVAAKNLGRAYFGCDISAQAVAIAQHRLAAVVGSGGVKGATK